MLYQVTAETATNEDPNMEYQHGLIQSGGCISPAWVLLDNQSAVDAFSNRRLLKNISKSDRELAILLTGVKMNMNLQGGIPGYGTVWFHPGGIANILSLSKVAENTVCTTTAPVRKTFSSTYPEENSGHSVNSRGGYSTQTWLWGRGWCL